jgi:putative transcriptional regulator
MLRALIFIGALSLCLHAALAGAQPQAEAPNGVLLVAKPDMIDPTFRETVVIASQTADGSTVGVILNRPTPQKHSRTGDPLAFGGPVMREVMVALYRAERVPAAAAFHVLKGVYLTMHPQNVDELLKPGTERSRPPYRLFMGFAGWAPGQLESELARDGWFVLPASTELLFRKDTGGMWEELVRKARGRVAMR